MKKKLIAAGIAAAFLIVSGCGVQNAEGQGGGNIETVWPTGEQENAQIPSEEESGSESADSGTEAESMKEQGDSGQSDRNTAKQGDTDTAQGTQNVEKEPVPPIEKTVSILGDSISTFRDYNPVGYAVFFPEYGEIKTVEETWWKQVMNDLGLTLYQNGSSSGATVAGDSTGTEDPRCACNELRTGDLAGPQGACPESIIVYLGTNDLMDHIPLGSNDGTSAVKEGMVATFRDAYTLMLDKLRTKYPTAQIYCCTLLPVGDYGTDTPYVDFVNDLGFTAADYSLAIRQIAENKGLFVIDLQDCGIRIDNLAEMTADGVHPTPAGMKCIAEAVEKAMEIADKKYCCHS